MKVESCDDESTADEDGGIVSIDACAPEKTSNTKVPEKTSNTKVPEKTPNTKVPSNKNNKTSPNTKKVYNFNKHTVVPQPDTETPVKKTSNRPKTYKKKNRKGLLPHQKNHGYKRVNIDTTSPLHGSKVDHNHEGPLVVQAGNLFRLIIDKRRGRPSDKLREEIEQLKVLQGKVSITVYPGGTGKASRLPGWLSALRIEVVKPKRKKRRLPATETFTKPTSPSPLDSILGTNSTCSPNGKSKNEFLIESVRSLYPHTVNKNDKTTPAPSTATAKTTFTPRLFSKVPRSLVPLNKLQSRFNTTTTSGVASSTTVGGTTTASALTTFTNSQIVIPSSQSSDDDVVCTSSPLNSPLSNGRTKDGRVTKNGRQLRNTATRGQEPEVDGGLDIRDIYIPDTTTKTQPPRWQHLTNRSPRQPQRTPRGKIYIQRPALPTKTTTIPATTTNNTLPHNQNIKVIPTSSRNSATNVNNGRSNRLAKNGGVPVSESPILISTTEDEDTESDDTATTTGPRPPKVHIA